MLRKEQFAPSTPLYTLFCSQNDINIKDCFICHSTTLIVFALQWQPLIYIHQTNNVIIKIIHTRSDRAHTSTFASSASSDINEELLLDRWFDAVAFQKKQMHSDRNLETDTKGIPRNLLRTNGIKVWYN